MRLSFRVLRYTWDVLAQVFRAHTAWGFIKHTKAGKLVAALGTAICASLISLRRSDPPMSIALVGLATLALIVVILHFLHGTQKLRGCATKRSLTPRI
jgi:hypothetical protein